MHEYLFELLDNSEIDTFVMPNPTYYKKNGITLFIFNKVHMEFLISDNVSYNFGKLFRIDICKYLKSEFKCFELSKMFKAVRVMAPTIEDLIGRTLIRIERIANDELIFILDDGTEYIMNHSQDCCESVNIDDICGDLDDLLNSPILTAREDVNNKNPEGAEKDYQDSFTWTFYNIATKKGHVTIRWYGESNGYYSESVDFSRK